MLGLAAHRATAALVLATMATIGIAVVGAFDVMERAGAGAHINHALEIVLVWVVATLVFRSHGARETEKRVHEFLNTKEVWQAVFDQTFQFIAALDLNGKIVEANQTLRAYAGLSENEIQSMSIWLLPIFENDSAVQERLQTAVLRASEGNFVREEFVVHGVGGQQTTIDFSLKSIREEGGPIRQIIMEARDVTEARMQDEMLVHAQKMEAVGALTAGVAHDFNNLLTVIVGNLELLERRIQGNESAQKRLDRAISAAFSGQALTQQLLAFSRRQPLNPVVIDINTLLNGMNQLYETLGDDIDITFDLADDLPPTELDPILLETALLNIAINARDAMPEGGKLHFQTALSEFEDARQGGITEIPPGEYICLSISDTGEGISPDILSQVFDPFFTTKPEGHGTGLGLSMVYGFVKQSGGDVNIYSETGKGTTIRIFLPTTDKPLPARGETWQIPERRDSEEDKLVLLVDDNDEVREVVLSALLDLGCRVETAASGDAAIELIRAGNEYDLIFTDMVMSGNSGGTDVARAARAARPNVPIIFCSGFPRKMLQGEEAAVEGAFFLAKPFHQAVLVGTVHRALARSARQSAKEYHAQV
ncbi:MAG: ATP-binding protein [Alphaproteobacteria bacterium]